MLNRAAGHRDRLRRALGAAFRKLRRDRHYIQREVSKRAGVAVGFISDFENGKTGISVEVFDALCSAIRTNAAIVLGNALEEC